MLRLLGTPLLLCGAASQPGQPDQPDQAVARPLGRNDALLLALLATQGGLARTRVAALLWPDHAPADAARSLRQRVHQLKRAAGADVLLGDPVLALAAGIHHDLATDDAALDTALDANPQALRGQLLDGVDLCALDELAELVAQWRMQWDVQRARALHRAADRAWAAHEPERALLLARRLVDENPGSDPAHRRLIELHYLLGDQAAALAAYDHGRQALQQSQGLAPSEAIESLLRAVRSARLPAAPARRPDPVLTRPPRLVGRDALWQAASTALAAARPVLLTGEAGIGKTRLLGDLAAARGGWPVVTARLGDADLPHALLARLVDQLARRFGAPQPDWVCAELSRLVPALGRPAAVEPFTVLRLQRALLAALRGWAAAADVTADGIAAGTAPRLQGLALDDLHFADAASLALLAPLVGESSVDGLPWLMAARPGELVARAPAWQQHMADAAWLTLPVPQLGLDAVLDLVRSLQLPGLQPASLAPRLAQATGGNPLFLLQTLAAMPAQGDALPTEEADPLPAPEAAVALIARRITQLGAPARQLLRLAALAEAGFSADLATSVLCQPALAIADAWAELEAAQLLRGAEMAHDLVRQAALAGLPEALARATHRDLALALAARGWSASAVARHWQAAHAWREAAGAWDAAAQAAHARSATAEEVAALQAAQACLQARLPGPGAGPAPAADDGDDDLAFDLGLRHAQALLCTFEPEAALAQLQALQPLLRGALQHARWLQVRAQVLVEQQSDEGLACAQQAMAVAATIGDATTTLLAAQRAAKALMRLDRLPEALALMPAEPPGLAHLVAEDRLYWLSDRALLLEHANLRSQSLGAYDRVITEAEAQQRWLPAADACSNKAVALMYLGQLLASSAMVERSLAFSRRAGVDGVGVLIDEMNLAGNWRDLGWFDRYLARAERLPDELRAAGLAVWAVNSEHDLAVAYVWLGRVDLCHRLLAPLADGLPEVMRAVRLITRVRLARDFGAAMLAPRPAALLDEAETLLDRGGNRSGQVRQALAMERAMRADPVLGAARLAQIAADALAQENTMASTSASRMRTQLLTTAGNHAAAAESAAAVLALVAAHGPPPGFYAPALWWTASQALAVQAPAQAAQLVLQAASWVQQTATQVPPLYRDSFLQRNPVNQAVLQAARLAGARPRG